MYFGEDIYLTFQHENRPTLFGSMTKEDMRVLKDVHEVERFKEIVKNLPEEERELLS